MEQRLRAAEQEFMTAANELLERLTLFREEKDPEKRLERWQHASEQLRPVEEAYASLCVLVGTLAGEMPEDLLVRSREVLSLVGTVLPAVREALVDPKTVFARYRGKGLS